MSLALSVSFIKISRPGPPAVEENQDAMWVSSVDTYGPWIVIHNMVNGTISETISLEDRCRGLLVDPDNDKFYVGCDNGAFYVWTKSTRTASTTFAIAGGNIYPFALSSNWVWVSDDTNNRILLFPRSGPNANSLTISTPNRCGRHGVQIGDFMYVGLRGAAVPYGILKIHIPSLTLSATLDYTGQILELDYDAVLERFYVCDYTVSRAVTVLNSVGTILQTILFGDPVAGSGFVKIDAANETGIFVYSGVVSVFNTSNYGVGTTVTTDAGGSIYGMDIDTSLDRVWVSDYINYKIATLVGYGQGC